MKQLNLYTEDQVRELAGQQVELVVRITGTVDGDGDLYVLDSETFYVDADDDSIDSNRGHSVHISAEWMARYSTSILPAGHVSDEEVADAMESVKQTIANAHARSRTRHAHA